MAIATGVSGWEADAALTWFTAFASLLLVIGFAVWISGRASAAFFAVAIAATASARTFWNGCSVPGSVRSVVGEASGFGGWLFQVSWAPQHVAGAMAAVLACYVLVQMRSRREPWLIVLLALLAAAGFASSVWAGLTFAVSAFAISVSSLLLSQPENAALLRCAWRQPASSR